jgi:hypothetical protein
MANEVHHNYSNRVVSKANQCKNAYIIYDKLYLEQKDIMPDRDNDYDNYKNHIIVGAWMHFVNLSDELSRLNYNWNINELCVPTAGNPEGNPI